MAGGAGGGGGGKSMSDAREVIDDFREMIEAALDARQSRIYTAIPIQFEEFDKKEQVAKIKPMIKVTVRNADGKVEKKEFPRIEEAPVYFPSGGREDQQGQGGQGGQAQTLDGGGQKKKLGYMMTFPIKKGDEGIGIVSCRTLDFWHKESGEQEQGIARMHDPTDMMILPGVKSRPRAKEVEGGVDDKHAQFRAVNGKHDMGIDEDEDEGGLRHNTKAHFKAEVSKNHESNIGETWTTKAKETTRETEKVETAKAGKAIVKSAPKVIINST
jgi:hypothetical protein